MKSVTFLTLLAFVLNAYAAEDNISTSTTSVAGATEPAKSPFSVSMFTLGGFDDSQFKNADPSFYIYDGYVSFNYKVHKDLRFALRPAFNYSTEGNDYIGNSVTNKMTTRDFSMLVTRYNVFEESLPASMDFKTQARLYLPTSEGSKLEGMIARLRFEFEAKNYTSQYSNFRSYIKPSYYFQRTTSYLDNAGKIKTTKQADVQYGVEYNWNLNKLFSVLPGFEVEDTWANASEANAREQRHDNSIAYRLGLEVRPMRAFNFTVGIQSRHDLIIMDRPDVTSYSLMTNISIY